MNNEFLAFLFKEKIKNIIPHMQGLPKIRNNFYSENQENYPIIDDFFKFVDLIKISHEDLYTHLRQSDFNLAEILVGKDLSNQDNRELYVEKFWSLIRNDANFFKDLILLCLNSHTYLKGKTADCNKKIFIQLVDVGIERGFFNHFTEEDKQTQNSDYKQILIDKNVFSEKFNIENLVEKFSKNFSDKEVLNFFSMYSEDIYSFLKNIEDQDMEMLSVKLLDSNVKFNQENTTKELLLFMMKNLHRVNMDCSKLTENSHLRATICDDNSGLSIFAKLALGKFFLKTFLKNLEHKQSQDIVCNKDNKNGILFSFLEDYDGKDIEVDDETANILIETVNNSMYLTEDKKSNLIGSFLLYSCSKKINSKIFEQNIQDIVSCFSLDENKQLDKYLGQLLIFNRTMEVKIVEKITNKVKKLIKDDLYKAITDKNNSIYTLSNQINKLKTYIKMTGDTSCLDMLNIDPDKPLWTDIDVLYSGVKKKGFERVNIVYYLLKTDFSTRKLIIDWIINNNAKNFYSIECDGKDLLSYYTKTYNSDSRVAWGEKDITINYIASLILSSQESYDAILKDHPTKIKQLKMLNDESINKQLNYYKLNKKIQTSKVKLDVGNSGKKPLKI